MYIRTNPILGKIFNPLVRFCEWFGTYYPTTFVKIRYFARFHKCLDLKNPKTLNEKILYLSLCTDTSKWTLYADKYRVRDYIKELGLGDSLVKLYGKWDKAKDCNFAELPNQFVLKSNHGSGDVVIVKDKSKIDEVAVKKKFEKELNKPYGALEGGLHYMRIKPCLIAEELLDIKKQPIPSSSLIDYKIWCINGTPRYIWICLNRRNDGMENCLYDINWNDCSRYLVYNDHYRHPAEKLSKPKCLDRMLDMAKTISNGLPVLRCDFYIVDNKVYFGEMTLTSTGGMMTNYTDEFQNMMGAEIKL